jgi:hypothetical protein
MLTGKAAFDALATAAQAVIDKPYNFNGLSYRLTWIASVSGPFASYAEVGGVYGLQQIVPLGTDALVIRYSVAAGNGRNAVDAVDDLRVLTSASLPDNPTNQDLIAFAKQLLEDAR